jgi:hypothetical protein
MFYIKKLQSQELGSGAGARGRYFYISKKHLRFFPSLSTTLLNDTALISVINYDLDSSKSALTAFVYHNDKYTRPPRTDGKKPRDEYRLYMNSEIDPSRSYFNVDDIVAIKEIDRANYTYGIYRFSSTSPEYAELNLLLEGKNHNLVDQIESIEAFEYDKDSIDTVMTSEASDRVSKVIEDNIDKFDDDEIAQGAHLFNALTFRSFILNSYNGKCAVTGKVIKWKNFNNLEAAHIKPNAHGGPFLPSNGICMSKNIHWAFDKGFFTINNDLTIKVHPEIVGSELNEYDGKKIYEPSESFFKASPKYLDYHRKNIYELFKYSGQIRRV